MNKIANDLQALNEQRADKDKAKPPVVAANDYLVTEALTYMADLYPSHLLLAGQGNAKRMVPVKQVAPINNNEATMSVSIKNSMEEYNLIDAPVRHLRPYVSVLDGQSWAGQSAADFFTQTSTLVTLHIVLVAFQPLTQRGMAQHGSAQTTAHASTAAQESSYTPHQKQKQHRAYLIERKCFSVKKKFPYIGTE